MVAVQQINFTSILEGPVHVYQVAHCLILQTHSLSATFRQLFTLILPVEKNQLGTTLHLFHALQAFFT